MAFFDTKSTTTQKADNRTANNGSVLFGDRAQFGGTNISRVGAGASVRIESSDPTTVKSALDNANKSFADALGFSRDVLGFAKEAQSLTGNVANSAINSKTDPNGTAQLAKIGAIALVAIAVAVVAIKKG